MINKQKSLLLKIAFNEYGVLEVPGEKHNPEILQYFKEIGKSWVQTDETAWCSAWLGAMCKRSLLLFSEELDARSWLDVGIETDKPELGDIVVYWRESIDSWKGHVGIYIKKQSSLIYTLGGNQNNMVCIQSYHETRVISYRDITRKYE